MTIVWARDICMLAIANIKVTKNVKLPVVISLEAW
jgi:hypothetical protein